LVELELGHAIEQLDDGRSFVVGRDEERHPHGGAAYRDVRSALRRAANRGAVGVLLPYLGDHRPERVVRGLACAVPPEETGLPASEPVLVEQAEVEESRHRGLAIRQQYRVAKLRRLVEDGAAGV